MKHLLATAIGALCLSVFSAKAETTQCTEITSIPMTITQQGVYCLKKNLVTGSSTDAITVATNNVTIDLNGWKLGATIVGLQNGSNGIFAEGRKNITIRNGLILGFYHGVLLKGETGSGHVVENIRADGNTFAGLWVEGKNNIVRNNHVTRTGGSSFRKLALGIGVSNAEDAVVANNVVANVFAEDNAHGLYLFNALSVALHRNSVFGTDAATNRSGVYLFDTLKAALHKNHLVNDTAGGTGIFEGGSAQEIMCTSNVIRGYSTGETGCDHMHDNHIN